jgi:DNA repair protein RecN (Recombination protein N)
LTTLADSAYELRSYLESLEFNPKRLDQIEERLNLLGNLKRKYGGTVEAVISYLAINKVELDEVINSTEQIAQVNIDLDNLLIEMGSLADALSQKRIRAAVQLSQVVESHLDHLQMQKARFEVQILHAESPDGLAVHGNPSDKSPKGSTRWSFSSKQTLAKVSSPWPRSLPAAKPPG